MEYLNQINQYVTSIQAFGVAELHREIVESIWWTVLIFGAVVLANVTRTYQKTKVRQAEIWQEYFRKMYR